MRAAMDPPGRSIQGGSPPQAFLTHFLQHAKTITPMRPGELNGSKALGSLTRHLRPITRICWHSEPLSVCCDILQLRDFEFLSHCASMTKQLQCRANKQNDTALWCLNTIEF